MDLKRRSKEKHSKSHKRLSGWKKWLGIGGTALAAFSLGGGINNSPLSIAFTMR